jgi:homoserine acetyltransferase
MKERLYEGAILQNMRVGCVTHGTLSPTRDNAILVTHGTSGGRNSCNGRAGLGQRSAPTAGAGLGLDTRRRTA